jgi:hypothetical protein
MNTSHTRNDNKTGIAINQIDLRGEEEGWESLRPDACDALHEADDFLAPIDGLPLSLLPRRIFGIGGALPTGAPPRVLV